MSCERFKTRLLDFALGAEDAEFQNHVHSCAACRAELDAQRALLEKIDRGVAALVAADPSGDFAAHVRRRVAEQAAAPRSWFAGWMPVAATGLALLLFVAVWITRAPRVPDRARRVPVVAPAEEKREAPAETAVAPRPSHGGQLASVRKPDIAIGRPPRPGQMAANREPEVLVPRGEMAAVTSLVNANWSGRADGAALTAQAAPMSEALKPLVIQQLKIPALEIAPGEKVEPGKESWDK